mgnify:CR=1 FL=1
MHAIFYLKNMKDKPIKKKLFTREWYSKHLIKEAKKMAADKALQNQAMDMFIKSAEYGWYNQTEWFGEPTLNPAQDMFARQEIIYKTKPDYIIELGVAWGGSLLFYSTMMEIVGGKKIIGVDIYIPPDLVERINSHKKLSRRITLINGSSTEETTINKIKRIIGDNQKLLVICDSNHTHDHVLSELRLYSDLVGKGYYMICDDTFVEQVKGESRINTNRPWGPGNNPETARRAFMNENKNFEIDKILENKLLISCNANGYLRRIK